ncbi:MAG: hypothetical protein QOG23_3618 [Blastocatellia bacterium]|jgi:hypothetical protein|nr:hypothetical protein [Blastocatellia bacterium]
MSIAVVTIFISHISEERELADILKQHLIADFGKKVRVFVSSDLESINAGDEWLKSIKTALNRAKVELILCSRLSITRPWVNFEVGAAWLRKIPIVPVCHSGLQVGDLPVPYNAWNGVEAGEERDLEKLYKSIAKSAGVKSPAVDFRAFAAAVQGFESTYAVEVRMRGKGGALVDLNQADRLVGTWKGQGCDIEIPKTLKYKTKFSYELTLNLQRRQGLISGKFEVHTFERDRTDTAFIELINVSGEYFYFKYWVAIPQANHCGFMLMQLSIAGDELEGIFLTNKLFERQIGLGKLLFRRQS